MPPMCKIRPDERGDDEMKQAHFTTKYPKYAYCFVEKKCVICGAPFWIRKASKYLVEHAKTCRKPSCVSELGRRHRKKYYEKNREHYLKCHKEYYDTNIPKFREYQRNYRKKHARART